MRVALFCFGSRGDSEPLAALATALSRAGHEARLVTHEEAHQELDFEAYDWTEDAIIPILDRTVVEPGDSLLVDYAALDADELWLEERNAILTVGANNVPTAISEGLVGARVPSEKDIVVTFPAVWPDDDLKGRTVSIRVSLKRLFSRPKTASASVAPVEDQSVLGRARAFALSALAGSYRAAVRATHYATTPLCLPFFGRELTTILRKPSLYWPSFVDVDMFEDAWQRSEWRIENPVTEGLVMRWYEKRRSLFDSRSAFHLVHSVLAGADRAVIAAGADDPARERLILHVAAKLGIPCFRVDYFPDDVRPKTAWVSWLAAACCPPLAALSNRTLAAPRNLVSYFVAAPLYAGFLGMHGLRDVLFTKMRSHNAWLDTLNRAASELGWPATTWNEVARADYAPSPVFTVHSKTLLPREMVSGAWLFEPAADWTPPSEVVDFLNAQNEHPILMFSTIVRDRAFQRAANEVLRDLPNPAIFNISREDAIPELQNRENVLFVRSIPHRWLFPKVALAVHHGGSGHVHAALGAGIPSVVVPGWGDQYLWADRVWTLRIGPPPIPHLFLTGKNLRRAIEQALTDETIRYSVQRLSAELATERGLEAAVAALETAG